MLDPSRSVPSQAQRPFSSRPDGPIGWIEPDEATTASNSESAAPAVPDSANPNGGGCESPSAFQTAEPNASKSVEHTSTGSLSASQMVGSSSAEDSTSSSPALRSSPGMDSQAGASSSAAAEGSPTAAGSTHPVQAGPAATAGASSSCLELCCICCQRSWQGPAVWKMCCFASHDDAVLLPMLQHSVQPTCSTSCLHAATARQGVPLCCNSPLGSATMLQQPLSGCNQVKLLGIKMTARLLSLKFWSSPC